LTHLWANGYEAARPLGTTTQVPAHPGLNTRTTAALRAPVRRGRWAVSGRRGVAAFAAAALLWLSGSVLVPPSAAASVVSRTAAVSSAVNDASLQVSSLSAGATHVTYSVTFRAVHALSEGSSTITLLLPSGATVVTPSCGDYADLVIDDATASAAACGNLTVTGQRVTITSPSATSPGDIVTVLLYDVINPVGAGLKTVTLRTSSDPGSISLHFVLAPATAVSDTSLDLSSTSAGASPVTYSVTFKSPDRFLATDDQRPTIALVAPAGTIFPPYSCGAYEFIDDTETSTGGCGPSLQVSRAGATVTVNPPSTNPGDLLTLVIRGVENAPAAGVHSLSLSTSADPKAATVSYTLLARQAVSHPFVQLSSYASSATDVTWSVGFVSPDRLSGSNSATGNSTVTIIAPPGTKFPPQGGCSDVYTFVDPIDGIDHCVSTAVVSDGGSKLVVQPLTGVTSTGAVMALVINGVTNPPALGTLHVSTTSDPAPVALPTSGPVLPSAAVQLDSASSKATMVSYVATFAMKSAFNAANCFSKPTKITLAGPSGTIFPAGGYVLYDLANGTEASAAACESPSTAPYVPGNTVPVAPIIAGGDLTVKAGDYLAVVARSVVSAPAAGTHHLSVSASTGTTVDPAYALTPPAAPGNPLWQALSTVAGASEVHYAVTFRVTGGLLPDYSAIGLSLPGATWGPGSGDNDGWTVYDDTTGLEGAGSAYYAGKAAVPNRTDNSGPALVYPSTGTGFRATPGDLVTIATDGTTNPAGVGAHVISVFTSGDPLAAGVPLMLTPAVPPAVRALNVNPDQAGQRNATVALTFVATAGLTPNWSSISMSIPGITWTPGVGDGDGFVATDDTTDLAAPAYATVNGKQTFQPASGPAVATPGTGTGFYGAAGDVITLSVKPVVVAGAGSHTIIFSTSTDPARALASVVLK
jgi:hypothetical protein